MIKDLDIDFDHDSDTITGAMGINQEGLEHITDTLNDFLHEHGPLSPSRFIEKVIQTDKLTDKQKVFALYVLGGSKEDAHGPSPLSRNAMKRPLN